MEELALDCPCGEIGLSLTGPPRAALYCHCDDCQVAHGAVAVPVVLYRTENFRLTRGTPVRWQRVRTPRASCPRCAARLWAEPNPAMRGVIATLLPRGLFTPTMHIYCSFARLPIKDDLPHYATVPAAFGGSDDQVAW